MTASCHGEQYTEVKLMARLLHQEQVEASISYTTM